MNWKALLTTIGLFAAIVALAWLCKAYNVTTWFVLGIAVCVSGVLFYAVYFLIKCAMEERDDAKQS